MASTQELYNKHTARRLYLAVPLATPVTLPVVDAVLLLPELPTSALALYALVVLPSSAHKSPLITCEINVSSSQVELR